MESARPPRLSTFYAGLGNGVRRPHPQVIQSISPGTVKVTNVREEFQFPEGIKEAEEWSEARKSVPKAAAKYKKSYYVSEENARTWGNILSKHNTYENAVNHIRGRDNLTYESKAVLEQSAARLFEPEARRPLHHILGLPPSKTRKRTRRHRKHRARSQNHTPS